VFSATHLLVILLFNHIAKAFSACLPHLISSMATSNRKPRGANGILCNLKPLPKEDIISSSTSPESEESEDSEDCEESSAEEEIITEGARIQLSSSPLDRLSTNHVIKALTEHEDSPTDNDEPTTDDEEEDSDVETESESEPEVSKSVRQVGFPPPEELPSWFPENIKQIYRIDRHGGALKYSVSAPSPFSVQYLTTSRNSTKLPGTDPRSKIFADANGGNTLKPGKHDGNSNNSSTASASDLERCRRSFTNTGRNNLRIGRIRRWGGGRGWRRPIWGF